MGRLRRKVAEVVAGPDAMVERQATMQAMAVVCGPELIDSAMDEAERRALWFREVGKTRRIASLPITLACESIIADIQQGRIR